jgi:photosystem II stability/assembly factor-like uncharacterized protein
MLSATEGWAVSTRDILHTTDGGATWAKQPHPANDVFYNVNFFDAMHGLVSSNNAVYYTTNGGQTWAMGSGVIGSIYFVEMADANTAFASYGYTGYFRTTNGGQSWTHHTMPSNIGAMQFFDALNGVANSPSATYHTTNGGNSWNPVGPHGGTFFLNHNLGWRLSQDVAERTTDGGATWQAQALPGGSWVYDSVFVDENNGWGVGSTIVRTTNGGATWTTSNPPGEQYLPLWAVDFADPQHGVTGGDVLNFETHLHTSSDGGATWDVRVKGSKNEMLDVVALDQNHIWGSHVFGKITRSTDGGQSWHLSNVDDPYSVLHAIDMANQQVGWAAGQNEQFGRIYRTTDGGVTWLPQYDGVNRRLFSVDALNAQTAIVVGGVGSVRVSQRTIDGGNNWHPLTIPLNDSFFEDVFFLNESTGWIVGNEGGIAKSTDGGNSWAAQNAPETYGLTSVHFSDPMNGWAGGWYQILLHTTNGGSTWTMQDPVIPEFTHVLDVESISATHGWISGYGGGAQSRPFVKYTTNGGQTWIDHTPQVGPYDSFSALSFLNFDYGWAGGYPGVFRHTSEGSGTPVPTAVRTNTPVPPTWTPQPPTATRTATRTNTQVSTPTNIPTSVSTNTPAATSTPAATGIATGTSTPCTITFTDVNPTDHFYEPVEYLYCQGAISGYADNTFRPYNSATRGQITKIVAIAEGWPDDTTGGPHFNDVPENNPFYPYIETAYNRGVISGYSDGSFRWGNNVTRGQLTKIVVQAEEWNIDTTGGPHFTDVPPADPFYSWIETAYNRGIISGYSDRTFRPGNSATRGQISKIIHVAVTQP